MNVSPRHYDIFISYSRADGERVRPLVQELRRLGYKVFFDVESISIGERWKLRLDASLRTSRALVLCWSAQAKVASSRASVGIYQTPRCLSVSAFSREI